MTTDVYPPAKRSAVMARVKGRDTKPELIVRKTLWRLGARYRLHRRDLPGSPDIVLPGRRLVVFVHGCFWHGHDCRLGRIPKSRVEYWEQKIAGNRERDARNLRSLSGMHWKCLVLWECQLKDDGALADRIRRFLDD